MIFYSLHFQNHNPNYSWSDILYNHKRGYDGIFSAEFKGIPASFQQINLPDLNQGNLLLEVNMLRDLCGWFFVNS